MAKVHGEGTWRRYTAKVHGEGTWQRCMVNARGEGACERAAREKAAVRKHISFFVVRIFMNIRSHNANEMFERLQPLIREDSRTRQHSHSTCTTLASTGTPLAQHCHTTGGRSLKATRSAWLLMATNQRTSFMAPRKSSCDKRRQLHHTATHSFTSHTSSRATSRASNEQLHLLGSWLVGLV